MIKPDLKFDRFSNVTHSNKNFIDLLTFRFCIGHTNQEIDTYE